MLKSLPRPGIADRVSDSKREKAEEQLIGVAKILLLNKRIIVASEVILCC